MDAADWIITRPLLLELVNYLKGHVGVTDEIAALIDSGARPDPNFKWATPSALPAALSTVDESAWRAVNCREEDIDIEEVEACNRVDPMKLSPFRKVVEKLNEAGHEYEAAGLLEAFGDSFENAAQALKYVDAILVSLAPKGAEETVEPDGPVEPDLLFLDGKQFSGLQNVPWRLLNELWDFRGQSRSVDDLAKPVWDCDDPVDMPDNAARSAVSKANLFFRKHGIPLTIRTRQEYRYMSLVPTAET